MRANKGAAGIDGETMSDIAKMGEDQFVGECQERLMKKSYRPQSVRRHYIPKKDGRQRPLGILTVRDRVVHLLSLPISTLKSIVAVTGVGISTTLFGVLPTVEQIGVIATLLFIALRLIQGIFVGGVVASTHTIGTETVSPKWRGLMSGLIGGGGAGIGSLFASIWYFVVSSIFPGSSFDVWGWRVMFFSGIVSAILGLFVFKSLAESQLWLESKNSEAGKLSKTPVRTVFPDNTR